MAYVGFNHSAFPALFVTARLGAIFGPLNSRWTGHELGYPSATAPPRSSSPTTRTSAVHDTRADLAREKLGSCGTAGMLDEVRLIDFDGNVLANPGVGSRSCSRSCATSPLRRSRGYELPLDLRVVGDFPRKTTGKLLKHVLREGRRSSDLGAH